MPAKKSKSTKNKSAKFMRLSKFNPLHAFLLIAVFSVIGAVLIYNSQATPLPWLQLAKQNSCRLNRYGIPPTLHQGTNGKCTKMLKYILKNRGTPAIKKEVPEINQVFGTGTATAVKMVKKDYKIKNTYGTLDDFVTPQTWLIIAYIWLHGYYPKAYQPPPPPNTGLGYGQKPPFSGKLNSEDTDNFDAQYSQWALSGWCIVNHESRNAGMYTAIQNNGQGPATGAFQFEGGYSNAGSNTWNSFYDYKYAALAPADVQWTKFFQVWANSDGASHWNGTHCSPAS